MVKYMAHAADAPATQGLLNSAETAGWNFAWFRML
jgi:hypothetical protein